jgi:hypothetical protein
LKESSALSNRVVELRISRDQAAFLQANLNCMAMTTRRAMTQPGMEPERHAALIRRAFVLESADDAVRSAMLEVPNSTRKSARGVESLDRGWRNQVASGTDQGDEDGQALPMRTGFRAGSSTKVEPRRETTVSVPREAPTITSPVNEIRSSRVQRAPSNAWLSAFIGGCESSPK